MTIKVLGKGCANCKRLYQLVEIALRELKKEATILYITDLSEIVEAGIMKTPGLIINQNIVSTGRIPSLEEIKTMILNAGGNA